MKTAVRVEAAVTIGSLAKGTSRHIELIITAGTIALLLSVIEESDPSLIDACLCCLRTLAQHDTKIRNIKYTLSQLEKLLSFAGPAENMLRQSCVASILIAACRGAQEQNDLCTVHAPSVLASLVCVEHLAVRIPTLTCIAAMSFNNKAAAMEIANTSYKDIKIPYVLVELVSRDKPIEMQLEAAKCLTNIHR